MKKRFLLLLPLVFGFISCGGASDKPNPETVNEIKELLSMQDLSEFHSKYLRGIYTQEYDVLDIYNDEGERSSNYFNYSGSGIFGMYYDLTKDAYDSIVDEEGNIDVFDTMSVGIGYYGLVQTARTMSFNREGGTEAQVCNLDILQNMYIKSTDENVLLENTLFVSDTGIFQYETRQELSASINKELLFGSISSRTFRDIFSQVDLFDTPGNVEHLDKLFIYTCRDLLTKTDEEIGDFIIENQISIKQEDDIEVSFVFNTESVEEEETDYIYPGAVEGTLFFDKDTYQLENFKYEIAFSSEKSDEDTDSVKLIKTKFTCEGESKRGLPEDHIEPLNPTVYDDVAEFLKDVNEQVVPPNIHL